MLSQPSPALPRMQTYPTSRPGIPVGHVPASLPADYNPPIRYPSMPQHNPSTIYPPQIDTHPTVSI